MEEIFNTDASSCLYGIPNRCKVHKRIQDLDSPLTISAEMPDEVMVSKEVLAGSVPADWRAYERVEFVIGSEDAVGFRGFIKDSAERAVYNVVIPALKTFWRLGCQITTKQLKMPKGPIWSWDEAVCSACGEETDEINYCLGCGARLCEECFTDGLGVCSTCGEEMGIFQKEGETSKK